MADAGWRLAEPYAHTFSEDDVLLVQAVDEIARRNAQESADTILAKLMSDYWRGRIALYTSRQRPGYAVDQHGTVRLKRPFSSATNAAAADRTDGGDDALGAPTLERDRFNRPREKFLWLLQRIPEASIDQEYAAGEATWAALAAMTPRTYDPAGLCIPALMVGADALAAWCNRSALDCPAQWRTAQTDAKLACMTGLHDSDKDLTEATADYIRPNTPPPQPATAGKTDSGDDHTFTRTYLKPAPSVKQPCGAQHPQTSASASGPTPNGPLDKGRARSRVSEPRLRSWCEKLLLDSTHQAMPLSRNEAEKMARDAFPGQQVDRARFRELWKEVGPRRGKGGRPAAGGRKPGNELWRRNLAAND